MDKQTVREPWVVRSGRWLTKRRGIMFAPFFTVVLFAARWATSLQLEIGFDLLGIICLVAGTRLRWVAASYHESSHHSEPITAGPYAWVRHPLYLSNFLLGFGIVLIAGWWPMIVLYDVLFLPVHVLIARSEEVHLTRLYGERYEIYRRAVPALLPWRRFGGPRYGSPSPFKLQKGQEGLKAIGYLAGALGILLVKQLRQGIEFPSLHPLSWSSWQICSAIGLLLVIFRPKTRSSILRVCQTTLAILGVAFLAIHVPGIWPSRVAILPGDSHTFVEEVGGIHELSSGLTPAASPEPVSTIPGKPPPASATPVIRHLSVGSQLWNHSELLGGVSAFGIVTAIEKGREGKNFRFSHELNEAGQTAFVVSSVLALWKQWRRTPQGALMPKASEESWQWKVHPTFDRDGVTLSAIFKRRF